MESLFLTRDQALSLWSESTDSKFLDHKRTNPREYQIVRIHTKETLEYNTWHHPTLSSILCWTLHPKNKQNKNKNPINSRQYYHLTQPFPSKENNNSTPPTRMQAQVTSYTKLTQTTGQILGGQKPNRRKNSTLKPGKRRPQTQ